MVSNRAKGLLLGLVSTIIWGCQYSVSRFLFGTVEGEADPLCLMTIRLFLGALALAPVLFFNSGWGKVRSAVRDDMRSLIVVAFVVCILEGVLAFASMKFTTAARSSLLCNASPIFTVIFAALAARKWPTWGKNLGMVWGFVGLVFALTAKAKAKVQAILRRNSREIQKEGEELLNAWLLKNGFEQTQTEADKLAKYHDVNLREEFFQMLGERKIVLGEKDADELNGKNKKSSEGGGWRKYVPFVKAKKQEEEKQPDLFIVPEKFNRKKPVYINEENIGQYICPDCCHPIPGDDTLGYIDNSNRIEIHKRACPVANKLKASYGNRILDVKWDMHKQLFFDATIRLGGIDRRGLVNEVTRVISTQLSVDIRRLTFTSEDGIFEGSIDLRVHDRDDVKSIMESLKDVEDLKEISQIM